MGKGQVKPASDNFVLPVGGRLDAARSATIDQPNALPMFKHKSPNKGMQHEAVFTPTDPNESNPRGKHVHSGQAMHSDPFGQDRPIWEIKAKKLIHHPAKEDKFHYQLKRVAPGEPEKERFITGNGLVSRGGKVISDQRFTTTFDTVQPSKDYANMMRFRGGIQQQDGVELKYDGKGKRRGEADARPSLQGVMIGDPIHAQPYNYRPPWGTKDSPRAKTAGGPAPVTTPWASGGNFAVQQRGGNKRAAAAAPVAAPVQSSD